MATIRSICAAVLLAWSAPASAGELPVVGTGDGIDVLQALGAAYTAEHPDTVVLVPPSIHSSGGIAAVGSEKEVLGRIARPLSDAEKAMGIIAVPAFRLPGAIFVNRGVGVTKLTSKQLADVYSGDIKNWKEVGGTDLRIKVVRREDVDSVLNVLRKTMPGWKDLVITDKSKTATTTQDAFETVQSVPGSIGFGPYTKTLENTLVVLTIDGTHPRDVQYPSAIALSLIYKQNTITPEAKKFLAFLKTAKAKQVLNSQGAVPFPD
jgi:phosphate transport system substrate-binding protein